MLIVISLIVICIVIVYLSMEYRQIKNKLIDKKLESFTEQPILCDKTVTSLTNIDSLQREFNTFKKHLSNMMIANKTYEALISHKNEVNESST